MKKQTTLIMAIAATAAIATIGTVALVKAPALNNFVQVKASTKSVTLDTTEKLQAVTFSELDLGTERKDKQFQISLGNDKYINGALVFSDCGNQFVGKNLSEPFGLDNSKQSKNNAFNFNFMFSFEKNVTKASVTFTVVDTADAGTDYASRLRYKNNVEDDSSQFYTIIKNNWDPITDFDSGFFNGSNLDAHQHSLSTDIDNDSLSCTTENSNNTIINFNFNSVELVPAGDVVTIQITSISFEYECK